MRRQATSSRRLRRGFALLLAVALLSFLLFLVVGLGTHARLESGSVGNAVSQRQARELALFAQQVALNRLQAFAGPDQRVTATATGSRHAHWTGIWDSRNPGTSPLTWLVSGNEELPLAVEPDDDLAAVPVTTLVGANSSGMEPDVVAPLQPVVVRARGDSAETLIGRYAWWVDDQGVKAPVAGGDYTDGVDYSPYDSAEARARLKQLIALGVAATDSSGNPVFETRSPPNEELFRQRELIAQPQLALVRAPNGEPVGLPRLREHFHDWSLGNAAILANTAAGGLRQDLSLCPELLGPAFEAWMDYADYLEPTQAASAGPFSILPAYGTVPVRRRHRMVAPVGEGDVVFTTAPVLVSFFLQFNVRRLRGNSAPAATTALEVRTRMVMQLWNPWTTAMVPEALRLDVTGLPRITVRDSNGGSRVVSLGGLFGEPMRIELTPEDAVFPGDPDDHSWLPGRVYAWRSRGGTAAGWQTEFYHRTLSVPNANVWAVPAGFSYAPPASNSAQLWVTGDAATLGLTLRKPDGTVLWRVTSPPFAAFSTTPQRVNTNDEYRFGFPIRIVDPVDFAAAPAGDPWLATVDPRARVATEPLYRFGSGGDLPSAYVGVSGNSVLTDENRLLDRVMGRTGMSYNEDAPLFELPRLPVLSLGQLQHLQVAGQRPFSIGNSWGANAQVRGIAALELFDRAFCSGLVRGVDPPTAGGRTILPQPYLRLLGRKITVEDLRAAPQGYSSKFLLRAGAFNLNSTSVAAWLSVLRSGRVAAGQAPTYLDASVNTGTAADEAVANFPEAYAAFYRFPQSAQETFKADPGYAASSTAPPDDPNAPSLANSHLYRRGVRFLDQAQTVRLAEAIVRGAKARRESAGPFRSVAEFLGPHPGFDHRSLLEHALAEAGINADIPEFSSQWLTQGDLMTLLAPMLFARSDTFAIRSYGEATNPLTGAVEARAWCEAMVQRLPEYFDAADAPETPPTELGRAVNEACGRRFKVISFRWLTRFDI